MNTENITGHSTQLAILRNTLKRGKVHHAMLFTGISGIGKKIIAVRFLNALLCEAAEGVSRPCMECHACRLIAAGTYPDYLEVLPDEKGRIPIGDPDKPEAGTARWLIDKLSKRSVTGRTGVLIDGIDRAGNEAQNALLKTIEEPQSGAHLVITASNRGNLLPTILSRCVVIHFNPLSVDEIEQILGPQSKIAAVLSGGSAETAMRLADEKVRSAVVAAAANLAGTYTGDALFTFDFKGLQEKTGFDDPMPLIRSLFRHLMLISISGGTPEDEFSGFPKDPETLRAILKIVLASEKGVSNNMNIRSLIRGLLAKKEIALDSGFLRLDKVFQ